MFRRIKQKLDRLLHLAEENHGLLARLAEQESQVETLIEKTVELNKAVAVLTEVIKAQMSDNAFLVNYVKSRRLDEEMKVNVEVAEEE